MRIGYLHIGAPQHGISRYGRLLAAEAKSRADLSVVEAEVVLTGNRSHDRALLINAAQKLSQAEIVHFQYNRSIWGEKWSQLDHLNAFMQHCRAALVVTLHDIFYPPSSLKRVQRYFTASEKNAHTTAQLDSVKLREVLQGLLREQLSPDLLALRKVIDRSRLAFVCTQEEARRLSDRITPQKLSIIPHFVETRCIQTTPAEARKALNLEDFKVVTLLGFIYSGKGHELLIQALTQLPQEVKVVFAGGASVGHEQFLETLMELAKAEGVSDRLRVTGYLSEAELEQYLIATDLAVCPFKKTSASGSLSTWISVARPILAFNIPQVAEYNQLRSAIKTFDVYTPLALSSAIQNAISQCSDSDDVDILALRQQLSISQMLDRHFSNYCSVQSTLSDRLFV